ncbi:MAG: TlpA disulfide reductase family protein [Actinomycetota bacterium]
MSDPVAKQGQFAALNQTKDSGPKVPVMWVVLGVVAVVALAAAVAIGITSGGDDGTVETSTGEIVDAIEAAPVDIDGPSLPEFTDPTDDPAIGQPAPELTGVSYTGEEASILFDGRPKVVVFLAHWCPVCQAELPEIVEWLEADGLRDDVDLYAVATALDRPRGNLPSEWFVDEGYEGPVLLDSEDSEAAQAFGLNAFPYWVVLDADGTVALRFSGLPSDVLDRPAADAFSFLADFAAAGE